MGEAVGQLRLLGAENAHTEAACLARIGSCPSASLCRLTRTVGGSRETEVNAFTVSPTGSPFGFLEATTVTPVEKWPMTVRNFSWPIIDLPCFASALTFP